MSVLLETVRHYVAELGWRVVPVLYRDKAPGWGGRRRNDWQRLRLEVDDLPRYFADGPTNVGVLLGEASGHLVDVDLDCPEALELAPRFLPRTWTFGRSSTPRAHWLYRAAGSKTERFLDPARSGERARTLLELRANRIGEGGPALQTVLPPSVHKDTGELVEWTPDDGDAIEGPRVVDAGLLRDAVAALAAVSLVACRAGMACARAWIESGRAPELSPEVARVVRHWCGLSTAPITPKHRTPPRRPSRPRGDLGAVVARYNLEHFRELPHAGSGQCPICRHRDCFGEQEPGRWACFSAGHVNGGRQGEGCFHGDLLDLDAHAARLSRVGFLLRQGYLKGQ